MQIITELSAMRSDRPSWMDVQLSDVLPRDLRNGTGKCLAYFYPVYFPSIDCSVFCGQVCNLCRADKLYKIYSANLYRLVS